MAAHNSPVSAGAVEVGVSESQSMTFDFDPDVELQPVRPTRMVNRRYVEVFGGRDEDFEEEEVGPLARDSVPLEAEILYGKALGKKFPNPDDVIDKGMLCSWCDKIAQPPIFMCQSGHLICEKDMGFVPNCPFMRKNKACRRPFVSGRHIFSEYMYNRIMRPCRNSEKGCAEVMAGQDKKKHEDIECRFND